MKFYFQIFTFVFSPMCDLDLLTYFWSCILEIRAFTCTAIFHAYFDTMWPWPTALLPSFRSYIIVIWTKCIMYACFNFVPNLETLPYLCKSLPNVNISPASGVTWFHTNFEMLFLQLYIHLEQLKSGELYRAIIAILLISLSMWSCLLFI